MLALFPGTFIRMFITDPSVVVPGIIALRTISIGFIFYGLGMVLIQSFNGAGDTVTPTKVYFVCFWLIEIPFAWLFSKPVGMGPTGTFVAIVAAEAIMTLISLYLFRKGNWKLKSV